MLRDRYSARVGIYTHAMPSVKSFATRAWTVRISLLSVIGISLLLASTAWSQSVPGMQPAAASLETRRQSLNEVFHDYWQDKLKHSPELASTLGDHRYDDELADESPAAYNDALARGAAFIDRLGAIDTAGMTEQEQLSKLVLVYDLVGQQESSTCPSWQTSVTEFSGSPVELPALVSRLNFTSADDYDHYVARLNRIPATILQVSANLSLGQQAGRNQPKSTMQSVVEQVTRVATAKPEDTPFAKPLRQFPSGISLEQQAEIRTAVMTAIRTKVQPAYGHLARYLTAEYIPKARTEPGLWADADGTACYAYLAQKFTTTDLTPDQINQIGQEDVARMQPRLLAIMRQLGYKNFRTFREGMTSNPKQHAQSEAQLIGLYRHYNAAIEATLPQLVTKIPKAPLEILPMDSFAFTDAPPAEYQPGTLNHSRSATVRVNTSAAMQPLYRVEATAYREGVPGHHLQNSLAMDSVNLPEFRRFEDYAAFLDGWASYAEGLGKDAGLYQEASSQYGLLEDQMNCAALLVVDTGVHSRRWTREQMVEYLRDHTALDDALIQQEIDRSIALPGHALGCDVGRLKVAELRSEAQKALGSKFDIRAFHDEVLDSGALPLDILTQHVELWIHGQQHAEPIRGN